MKTAGQTLWESKRADYARLLTTMEWREFSYRMKGLFGFRCAICELVKAAHSLTVHHHAYKPGSRPWEYGPGEISVVCELCHEEMHECLEEFRRHVFSRITPKAFRVLNGALAVGLANYDKLTLCYAVASLIASPGAVERFGKEFKG